MSAFRAGWRYGLRLLAAALLLAGAQGAARADFPSFVAGLWPEAQSAGISRRTFDAAFRGMTPDNSVIALTRKQSEFVRPIWSYIDSAVSASRIEQGVSLARRHADVLARVERQFGVDSAIVLAIWGVETSFGGFTGGKDVLRSLATLAYVRYRDDFFRKELIAALRILERGDASRDEMKGSWAGAMGQTQFMPTSYEKYAVDFSGDGHKDIWESTSDAFASTANYLRQYGWQAGMDWGYEVRLPEGIDLARLGGMLPFARWTEAGVTRIDGRGLPARGEGEIFLPGGYRGPAFLVTPNYKVIKRYNSSDAYAMGVAHLADRISGGGPIRGQWPRQAPLLTPEERKEVQRRLIALGHPLEKIDGRFGEQSRAAIRAFQIRAGLIPDGYADKALLARLRKGR